MYCHAYSKSMDQPGKRLRVGQLNRKNEYFPVRVRAWGFGPARRVRQSRPASACSSTYSGCIWCLLTKFLPSSAAASVYLLKTAKRHQVSPEFIGSHNCVPMALSYIDSKNGFRVLHAGRKLAVLALSPSLEYCAHSRKHLHQYCHNLHYRAKLYLPAVCRCFLIYSGRQTTRSGTTCGRISRRKATQKVFCGAFFARRIQPSLPSSTGKSNFVNPRHNHSTLVGHDVRNNPSSCDCAEILTHVPTSEGFEVTNWTTGRLGKFDFSFCLSSVPFIRGVCHSTILH